MLSEATQFRAQKRQTGKEADSKWGIRPIAEFLATGSLRPNLGRILTFGKTKRHWAESLPHKIVAAREEMKA